MVERVRLNFDAKPEKCALCGHPKGNHSAGVLRCPHGKKTRIGWIDFHPTQTFRRPVTSKDEQ